MILITIILSEKQTKELLKCKGPTSYFGAIGAIAPIGTSVTIIHVFIVTENSAINKISAEVEFTPHWSSALPLYRK